MKKTSAKKTTQKKACKIKMPAHAVDTFGKKPDGPPQFTHIAIAGFTGKPKYDMPTGFILEWGAKGMGFGELTFVQKLDGKIECETECMGREFVEQAIAALLKKVKMRAV